MSCQIERKIWSLIPVLILFAIPTESWAQAFERASQVTSPEVSEDRSITFRIFAPTADSVKLSSSDLPGYMGGQTMKKSSKGVWTIYNKAGTRRRLPL